MNKKIVESCETLKEYKHPSNYFKLKRKYGFFRGNEVYDKDKINITEIRTDLKL
jgi:hypothetical protein